MPRIDTAKHSYTDENGDSQVLSVPYDVNAEGLFMANVPEWLVANVEALRKIDARWKSVSAQQLTKNFRVTAPQLAPLKDLIDAALRDYSAPDVKTELVIRYCLKTEAAAWELPDGRLAANGREGERIWMESPRSAESRGPGKAGVDGYGAWPEELSNIHARNAARGGYMVRVGAVVKQKVTTTRGQSVKVEYQRVNSDLEADDPALRRLNAFVGLDMDDSQPQFSSKSALEVREIAYTPEAAEFFYTVMLGVAELALRMQRFIWDQTALIAQIQKGAPLLGMTAAAKADGAA